MKRNLTLTTIPNYFVVTKQKDTQSKSDFYSQYLPEDKKNANTSTPPIAPTQPLSGSTQLAHLQCEYDSLRCKFVELQTDYSNVVAENQKYKKDLAELRKLYNAACRVYVKKDMAIKLLQKRSESGGLLYDGFKEQLGDAVLKNLRKLSGNKRSDSTFILHCLRKLYTNPEHLKSKSAAGTVGKNMISPDKCEIIENIFIERLHADNLQGPEIEKSSICLNKLINDAIYNITRPKVGSNSSKNSFFYFMRYIISIY